MLRPCGLSSSSSGRPQGPWAERPDLLPGAMTAFLCVARRRRTHDEDQFYSSYVLSRVELPEFRPKDGLTVAFRSAGAGLRFEGVLLEEGYRTSTVSRAVTHLLVITPADPVLSPDRALTPGGFGDNTRVVLSLRVWCYRQIWCYSSISWCYRCMGG